VKATPLKPAILLDELLKIIRKYPLQAIEEDTQSFVPVSMIKGFKPEIIISEIYDN
jgi:hypothetical protein